MRRDMKSISVFPAFVGAVLLVTTSATALIMVSDGNKPVQNRGWPTGTEGVANLPSRLKYWEGPPFGGGEFHFEYQCQDTGEFNEALVKFGKIKVPRPVDRSLMTTGQRTRLQGDKPLLLVVHDWPPPKGGPGGDNAKLAWTFTVWTPSNFHRLFSSPKSSFSSDHPNYRQPVPPPRIDVYTGGEGPIVWEKVKVPPNVRVLDKRAKAAPVDTSAGGVVRGSVFDMATHRVIAGAEVILKARSGADESKPAPRATADENGSFEVREIPKGYYTIQIRADEYVARNVGQFDNRGGHAYEDFDALLIGPAALKGVVVGTDGKPLAGFEVSARNVVGLNGRGYDCADEPKAKTDENGEFILGPLPNGYTNLRCSAPSMHQETSIFELYRASPHEYEQERQDIKIVMSGTGIVRGKVVDEEGKPPSREFHANIEPEGGNKPGTWGGSAQCKEDGSFEFKGVPPGKYVISVGPNPGSSREPATKRTVTVEVGKTIELEIPNDYAHK